MEEARVLASVLLLYTRGPHGWRRLSKEGSSDGLRAAAVSEGEERQGICRI